MEDLKALELVDELRKRMWDSVEVLPDEPDFFYSHDT